MCKEGWPLRLQSGSGGGRRSEVGGGDGDKRLTLMDNLSLTTALEIYGGGGG